MRNKFFWIVVSLGVVIVFYLSWLPQPKLSAHWFMPNWLGKWADSYVNENLRTAVPFLFLGVFSGWWLTTKNKIFRSWLIAFALLVLVAIVAELGQLLLPARTCDVGDILWAAAGSFAGLVIVWLIWMVISLFSKGTAMHIHKKMPTQYSI